MEQILSVLYGASGIAASALYLPQILKYHRDRDARQSISLLAWGGWIVIAAITIAYALVVVRSPLIAAVAALNILAQLIVLAYGLTARLGRRTAAAPASTIRTSSRPEPHRRRA
jgi:cobalamin biosynthesis protein CobD/CbiB